MSKRILVIEDDPSTLAAMTALLTDQGYEVVTADDADSARCALERSTPDLVITDLNLQASSGMDVIRFIRNQPGVLEVPIIIVSGEEDKQERVRGFHEGADDYMSKPVEVEELLARVDRQLRRHAHEQEALRHSVSDELTKVLNRRGLDNLFAREIERCSREATSLSVLFVDLDRFKPINDTHGHVVGDLVLCAVAEALQDLVRATDRVGRLGGDEFLVIMPCSNAATAEEVAGRVRGSMPLEVSTPSGLRVPTEFSIGVATREPGEALEDLLARADKRMYADKQARRLNR